MTHTWINELPDAAPKKGPHATAHAVGYEKQKKGKEWKALWAVPPLAAKPMLTTGDGSVWTSVDDMVLYDAGINAGKLVKPATWKRAIAMSKTTDGKPNRYGYGFALETDDAGHTTAFGHEGSWGGFHTAYYRYTDIDRAVIILSNREDFKVGDVWEEVDALFAEKKAKANDKKK